MNSWLKTALCLCTMLSATAIWGACYAQNGQNGPQFQNSPQGQNIPQSWQNSPQNWRNSPDNWQNSSQNWQNNPQNWQNSPQNWQNSADNYNGTNGVYDKDGNRTGYVVPRADGSGINLFNNNGARTGQKIFNEPH